MESYILLFITAGVTIAAITSIGLAAEPSVEVSVTDVGWNETVSSTGTIAIGGISINVTSDSPTEFKNFKICAQLNSTSTTLSDVACALTGTLSPSTQTGFTKDDLPINFVNHLKVSELDAIAFDATRESELAVNVVKDKNVEIASDEVTITFEDVISDGTVNISAVKADDVSKTVRIIEGTDQPVVSIDGIDMTGIGTVVEINTTAEFTGKTLVVVPYDETLIPSGLSESKVSLLRFTDGAWVDITSSVDTSGNTVSGFVTGFSQFMAAAPPAPPAPTASPSAGGRGVVGSGPSGSGSGGAAATSPTTVLFEVHLYEVSWNTCDDNIMTVIAGPPSGGLGVKLRTAKSGLVTTTLAYDQPYTTKFVFEGRIEPSESFVMVQVEGISARGAQIVQEYINIKECSGAIIFEKELYVPVPPTTPTVPPSSPTFPPFYTMAPKISDGVTFETSYDDNNFEINYKMDTGIVKEMYVDEGSASVTFTMDGVMGGEFVLSLPRSLINADDDKFVVFAADSGQQLVYDIAESTDEYVIIRTMLHDGASKLTISGTSVVPEFASLTVPLLLITLVCVIVVTRLKTLPAKLRIESL